MCVGGEGVCFMNMTAMELDIKAKALARDYLNTESKLLELLIKMKRQKTLFELNYTGIFDYCERALKLSRAQSYYFKSVAEKSEEVPEIQEAIAQGSLTLSQARRIVPVINPENKDLWLSKAQTLSQKELERQVTQVNPMSRVIEKLKPVAPSLSELKLGVSSETEVQLKRLQEIYSQKKQRFVTLAEVIAFMTQDTLERIAPEKKLKRLRQPKPVSSRKHSIPNQPYQRRIPIPQRIKLQKLNEAQNRCTHTGSDGRRCQQKWWLELHHKKPISRGGGNEIENLQYLCSSHHRALHEKASLNDSPYL